MGKSPKDQSHNRIAMRLSASIFARQILAFVAVDIVIFLLILLSHIEVDGLRITGIPDLDESIAVLAGMLRSISFFRVGSFAVLITLIVVEALAIIDSTLKIRKVIIKQLAPLRELRAATDAYVDAVGSVGTGKRGEPEREGLKRMAESLGRVDAHDMEVHFSPQSVSPELRPLAHAIDEMLRRLEASYEAQAKFVSDASHELRTPIAVIQGYANLLSRWGTEDPDTLHESIEAIRSEAESMKLLVNQLLFLARGDNDTLQCEMLQTDLVPILEEVLREEMMIDGAHEISADFPNRPVFILGDASLIKQLVRILCDNSIKYTPEGESISLSLTTENGNALISITDEGQGIAPEVLPHVFERFVRGDEARTRNTGGSGLGLSIAWHIAERHGGRIEVFSREGLGSRFTVVLPLVV